MKTEAKSIIGKTITGIISRPATGGLPVIMVLQFSDGSCFEFVSPAAQRTVTRQARRRTSSAEVMDSLLSSQLNIFPQDGDSNADTAFSAAAA